MPKPRVKLVGDEANFRALYRTYKRSALKRKHTFDLTPARFREITQSHCYVCGKPPTRGYIHEYKKQFYATPYVCNGVDRFDNSFGYVEDNVVACCGNCNMAKGKLSIEEFLLHVYDIYKHAIEPAINEGVPYEHDEETDE